VRGGTGRRQGVAHLECCADREQLKDYERTRPMVRTFIPVPGVMSDFGGPGGLPWVQVKVEPRWLRLESSQISTLLLKRASTSWLRLVIPTSTKTGATLGSFGNPRYPAETEKLVVRFQRTATSKHL